MKVILGNHDDDACHHAPCRPFTARALREGSPESLLKDGDAFADDDHRVRQLRGICEEQVQQDARRSPPPPMPAEAQQVIYRPGDRPQQQTDPQPPELEGNFDLHRSAQQPGEKAALFPGRFVGDGVDAPLHL